MNYCLELPRVHLIRKSYSCPTISIILTEHKNNYHNTEQIKLTKKIEVYAVQALTDLRNRNSEY